MENNNLGKLVAPVVVVAAVIALFSSFYIISPGEVAIKTRMGAIVGSYSEGLHFKMPFVDGITKFSIQIQRANIKTQAFDLNALTGIGSFAISPAALPGSAATGLINLTYDRYSLSPNDLNFDPDVNTVSTGNTLSGTARVSVRVSAVPEPASFALIGLGLAAVGGFAYRRRKD